jgi:hypothetical protein
MYEEFYNGKKELFAVYFIGDNGCPWKVIQRAYNSPVRQFHVKSQKGSYQEGKIEHYWASLDKDSNEVLIEKRITHYNKSGLRVMEEKWISENGKIYKTTEVILAPGPDSMNTWIYRMDPDGDTIMKVHSEHWKNHNYYLYMLKQDGKWKEKQKRISMFNSKTGMNELHSWNDGKLTITGTKVDSLPNGTKIEYTYVNGELKQKTFHFHEGYTVYNYENGKEINKYTEYFPIGTPPPDDGDFPQIIDPELNELDQLNKDGKNNNDKEKQNGNKQDITKEEKPKPKEPVVKLYYKDPLKKDEVIMKEIFSPEGLILERDIVRDKKKFLFEYTFRK